MSRMIVFFFLVGFSVCAGCQSVRIGGCPLLKRRNCCDESIRFNMPSCATHMPSYAYEPTVWHPWPGAEQTFHRLPADIDPETVSRGPSTVPLAPDTAIDTNIVETSIVTAGGTVEHEVLGTVTAGHMAALDLRLNSDPCFLTAHLDFNRDGIYNPHELIASLWLDVSYPQVLFDVPANTVSGSLQLRLSCFPQDSAELDPSFVGEYCVEVSSHTEPQTAQ